MVKCDVQILGAHSEDASPSIYFICENERYLINTGEGCQRLCMEHHVRLSKLDKVFLTRITADTVGGLPGLLLTIADMGRSRVNIFGPDGTHQYLAATRRANFLRRDR